MWFFLGICSAIEYKIKPQTFIMLIAIVLVETFDDIKRTELKSKRSANTERLQYSRRSYMQIRAEDEMVFWFRKHKNGLFF